MKVIGVTGTQEGATAMQLHFLNLLFRNDTEIKIVHHGDCVGVDAQVHAILLETSIIPHIHPPSNPSKRAFCSGGLLYPEKDYLDRNHDIVDASEALIVVPKGFVEELRSGTWATYRYAKKCGVKRLVVFPDGTMEVHK